MRGECFMNWLIPNIVSLFRLPAAFFILYSAVVGAWAMALTCIIFGFLSDLIDGFLARRYNAETQTGKIIDIAADIILDESIIYGLVLTNQINWWLAIFVASVVIIIRLPTFSSQTFYLKLGFIMLPVYGCCMVWLIITTYALKALGSQGLSYVLALAVPVTLVIIWLKRKRINRDFKKFKTTFFRE